MKSVVKDCMFVNCAHNFVIPEHEIELSTLALPNCFVVVIDSAGS